jgi:mannose-6-phosphate isomerase-like protein (cupin superfamily)
MSDHPARLDALSLPAGTTPDRASIAAHLRGLGTEPYAWSNAPFDEYAAHEHGYEKLLICAAGSITFHVGPQATPVELHPGSGFVLPAGTRHSARVGPDGCTCLEGHRPGR